MTLLDDIYAALLASDYADLPAIKKYVDWVRIRRRVHDHFYLQAHWVQKNTLARRAHWL